MFEKVILAVALIVLTAAGIFFCWKRSLRYLQFFQQEEYEGARFLKWYRRLRAFDRRGLVVGVIAEILIIVAILLRSPLAAMTSLVLSGCLIYLATREENPLTTGKIRLKLTDRAKRIFNTAQSCSALIQLIALSIAWLLPGNYSLPFLWLGQMVIIQLQPFILVLAKGLLDGQEAALQAAFATEAQAIVRHVNRTVIGITGSYGKTSAKVILAEMLASVAPTFTTQRSINSYMGVTREIRERMKDFHHFAVIEMGAYYRGSIKRMCGLTPPSVGIVTAVGEMHLERFGSQDNLFKAKSELAEAVPSDGILIVNGDYEFCRKMASENPKRITLIYGLDKSKGNLDAYMYDFVVSDNGTAFKIDFQGRAYDGFASLLSKPLLSNALGCFVAAVTLGCAPEIALAALRNVKTENNRLEPVRTTIGALSGSQNGKAGGKDGKILRLNDAFNSNPVGFSAALDLLAELPGGKKILVTPGMIELAERQDVENEKAATKAGSICDMVVVVGKTNRNALLAGLTQSGLSNEKYMIKDTMQEALYFLSNGYCSDGDVVLIENDLPDLYESSPRF